MEATGVYWKPVWHIFRGRVTKHHRFPLALHLNQIDALGASIATIDQEVEAGLAPFRAAVELVRSVPGVLSTSTAYRLEPRRRST